MHKKVKKTRFSGGGKKSANFRTFCVFGDFRKNPLFCTFFEGWQKWQEFHFLEFFSKIRLVISAPETTFPGVFRGEVPLPPGPPPGGGPPRGGAPSGPAPLGGGGQLLLSQRWEKLVNFLATRCDVVFELLWSSSCSSSSQPTSWKLGKLFFSQTQKLLCSKTKMHVVVVMVKKW